MNGDEKIIQLLEALQKGQVGFEQGQKRLEQGQKRLEQGQKRLEQGQKQLEQGQKQLEQGQKQLEQGQKRLEQGQKQLEQGQKQLEQGQKQLEQIAGSTKTAIEALQAGQDDLREQLAHKANKADLLDLKAEIVKKLKQHERRLDDAGIPNPYKN